MDERSTIRFRSNIYPTSSKGQLINDRQFLDSISDPEALDILWHHNGSQGAYLNPLQRRQHDAAEPCVYAEDGDYPWGTSISTGRVVCLCEKDDCPRFGKCMDPQSSRRVHISSGKMATSSAEVSVQSTRRPEARSSALPASDSVRARGAKSVFTKGWSEEEKKLLRDAYFKCDREVLYMLFRNRSAADVDMQIKIMGLASMPRPRQARPKSSVGGKTRATQPRTPQKNHQQTPKKKRAKTTKNPAPWTVNEDVIMRQNYPRFGSDMSQWKKKLIGRKKGDIESRAQVLGLSYKPNGRKA